MGARLSDRVIDRLNADKDLLWPQKYSAGLGAQAQSLTYKYIFKAAEAGKIRHLSIYANLTGTVTFDVRKNNVTILSGVGTLTNNAASILDGLGTTGITANFNTVSDANKAKLRYEKGDLLEVHIITAAASTIVFGAASLAVDERQPRKTPAYA